MTQYYFLASLLPQLEIGYVPALGFFDLQQLLQINLTKEDKKKVKRFLRLIDIENMGHLFALEPIETRGHLNRAELEGALEEKMWSEEEAFSPYLIEFLEKYPTREERQKHFAQLISAFLKEESAEQEGFASDYFAFERNLRLTLVGLRSRKTGRSLEAELSFENSSDLIVAQLLAQKDAKTFEPPFEMRDLAPIFEAYSTSPLELHRALIVYRFNAIVEMCNGAIFTLDAILGYLTRLILVERWLELDVQRGVTILDAIEESIK